MADKTAFTLNTRDFDIKFKQVTEKRIPSAAERGLFRTGALIIRDAIMEQPQVPKSRGVTKEGGKRGQAPGHLRRSQKIENPKTKHGEISVEVGFNTDYAATVHEMPETTQWSTPGTGPKYLESKLIRNKEKYAKSVADAIKKESGR